MKLTNISREISYDGYPNYDVSVKPNATEFCGTPLSKLLPLTLVLLIFPWFNPVRLLVPQTMTRMLKIELTFWLLA